MNIIETNLKFKTKLTKIDRPSMIVIHHAAHSSATIEDIHSWHKKNGWSGIGYHFLIAKDGQIYRGRPENTMGAHCKSYNAVSLGICLQGNFEVEKISEIQFEALMILCHHLCNQYRISTVKGHKELRCTSCPGKNFPLERIKTVIVSNKNNNHGFDTYTVRAGDTLWSIAQSFSISVNELMELNNIKDSIIYPNQILKVIQK